MIVFSLKVCFAPDATQLKQHTHPKHDEGVRSVNNGINLIWTFQTPLFMAMKEYFQLERAGVTRVIK